MGTIIDEPDTPREDTPIKTYDSVESIATVKVDKTTLARIMPVRISIDELHDFLQKVPTDAVWEVQWNEECTNHYLIAENDNGISHSHLWKARLQADISWYSTSVEVVGQA